jgi:hypothetical protein
MSGSAVAANITPGATIHVEGLIIIFFERNPNNQIVACKLGALRNAPGHVFSVAYQKNLGAVTPVNPADPMLRLEARGGAQTGITFEKPNEVINRICGTGDPQSYRWVLDFEGQELYKKPIGADRNQFRSFLRFEHGKLSTEQRSENHLLIRPALKPTEPWILVGKVATKVRASVALDVDGSEVEFFNGATPVVKAVKGEQLDIFMKLTHPDEEAEDTPHDADANMYYSAIGQRLGAQEIHTFGSTKLVSSGPVAPEASCLVGSLGDTET